MSPKSHTLFHFTKNRETLKLILKNGFWPRFCLEDVAWIGHQNFDYVSYPMVCFCDIPLSRISEHVKFYGEFGLGMTRQWAEQNELNPVLYISGENRVAMSFRQLNDHANKLADTDCEAAKVTMRHLIAHAKPTTGTMVIDKQPVEKVFYQESEWRHIPVNTNISSYLLRSKHDDPDGLAKENKATQEHCMLKFNPKDVKYIFVKADADIPDLMNFISADLDGHPGSDLKILMSRVVSLESLQADL